MPQVPYNPVPSVEPDTSGTRGISINAPGIAFGETVAAAIGHLGQTIEHAEGKVWNRAVALHELQNESEARQADANYMEQAAKLHADYSSLRGEAAVKGLDGHIKDLKDVRVQIRDGLSTDSAKKKFDSQSMGFLGRNIFN